MELASPRRDKMNLLSYDVLVTCCFLFLHRHLSLFLSSFSCLFFFCLHFNSHSDNVSSQSTLLLPLPIYYQLHVSYKITKCSPSLCMLFYPDLLHCLPSSPPLSKFSPSCCLSKSGWWTYEPPSLQSEDCPAAR